LLAFWFLGLGFTIHHLIRCVARFHSVNYIRGLRIVTQTAQGLAVGH